MPPSPESPSPARLIALLAGAEALARTRDLRRIFRTATEYAVNFVEGSYGLLFAVRFTPPELTVGLLGCCVADGADTYWDDVCNGNAWLPVDPLLDRCVQTSFGHALDHDGDLWRLACAIGAVGEVRWVLEIHGTGGPPCAADREALALFLRCFESQHQQWEYANLDTLTRLLNRRTFDDDFERLIAAAEQAEQARRTPDHRREADETITQPCWLGVVDIDHFKKINDNFGHLFGDEVLLRVAELMHQRFRSNDKLFRFGGEEFVVMLRNVSEDDVQGIFDRFRVAVEQYDFPRIGHVACSLGFARIDPRLSPAELLGRADAALYYSKDNGRNQVNGFDELVMSGKLRITPPADQADIQSDIDEIFL